MSSLTISNVCIPEGSYKEDLPVVVNLKGTATAATYPRSHNFVKDDRD